MENILRPRVWKTNLSSPEDDTLGKKVISCRFDLTFG